MPEAARYLRVHPGAAAGAGDPSLGLRLDRRANWLRQTSLSVVAGPRQTAADVTDQLFPRASFGSSFDPAPRPARGR